MQKPAKKNVFGRGTDLGTELRRENEVSKDQMSKEISGDWIDSLKAGI